MYPIYFLIFNFPTFIVQPLTTLAITPIQNEQHLVMKLAQGDEDSFRHLFNHYSDSIFTVAFKYSKSIELSEEMVQDVFLKIWMNKEALEKVEKFSNYLFIVARNHILNVLRKNTKEPKFVEMLKNHFSTYSEEPYDNIVLKESEVLINAAINELTPQQQTAFRLCRLEGLSQQEVAEKMNISRLTVKYHVQQALRTMRNYIENKNSGLIINLAISVIIRLC